MAREVKLKSKKVDEPSATMDARAERLFARHPGVSEFHFTSDGLAFIERCDAVNHAADLKDNKIRIIKRK